MPLHRVLVANRGEIALRLIRTLKVMGLSPIAVYTDADRGGPHVRLADHAVPLGASTPAESYLNISRLIDAARECGADAVIPGYGFLSENADFAQACQDAGLTFIGPSPQSIRQMGSKIAARELALRAHVPLIPGGPAETLEEARSSATSLGYPLMIKASAGGGGKGMRLVNSPEALEDAFARAQSEALRAFGSGRVYLEKAILSARHVEVQVLGDQLGNLVTLGERECSAQRRHQKVLEECPAPNLSAQTRDALSSAALALAKSVNYFSVGTLEFLVDEHENFYFLEMNTRLQVEHTVTEMVSGLDLVEWMVRVARGESIADIPAWSPRGWSIQARLCAEDPAEQYRPSVGHLKLLRQPAGPGIRFDHWLQAETEVTSFYDPLLGKLCAHGTTREQARLRLLAALDELVLSGLTTNRDQLRAALSSAEFTSGRYTTNLLGAVTGLPARPVTAAEAAAAAAAHALFQQRSLATSERRPEDPSTGPWMLAYRPR
jgi:acetyl/propionyl-CoA carboxylase alpha subunit